MNKTEVATVLAKIQLGDNRDIDAAGLVLAEWFDTIGFLNFEDAIQGVKLHRQESTDYLQPAHVIRLANRVRDARAIAAGPVFCPEHDGYPLPCERCVREAEMSS
jgi:hypothetical protein